MFDVEHTWVLVLAAGDGSRLRSLTTTPSGTAVPKQFCSLYEGPSLLQEALARAHSVAAEHRTCAIVAEQHRRWWEVALGSLPRRNLTVQVQNRGTAIGILLPLLQILARDPQARLVLLPSDHHVRQESLLSTSLRQAVGQLDGHEKESLLLGVEPEEADPELGYIMPGASTERGAHHIDRFVEKPPLATARELVREGGLWNTFIVATRARALLEQFRRQIPHIVEAMGAAIQRDRQAGQNGQALAALYERLPVVDFSREIVCGQESGFRVLSVPRCGWSDLGTPKRVAHALRHTPQPVAVPRLRAGRGYLSLATQHRRMNLVHGAPSAS